MSKQEKIDFLNEELILALELEADTGEDYGVSRIADELAAMGEPPYFHQDYKLGA